MAGLAVGRTGGFVIETSRFPGFGTVTGGALSAKVIGWFVFIVTRFTVFSTGGFVVEGCWFPGVGVVAGGALARIVVCWFIPCMAGFTVPGARSSMVKYDGTPGER